MRILVQKFGGTSVATAEARQAVLGKVKQAVEKGFSPVVVVSAMGRKGAPYATDTLIDVLKEANISVNPREQDLMMCCGEIISACVMAATLQAAGFNARALTGGQAGIITDSQYGAARIKKINTGKLLRFLESDIIPVVCGFQGQTEENAKFTTLGRGGSDTTGTALGAALKAEAVEIYTDVDGIMTADPRIVKNATLMNRVSYSEVCQMAHQGAKVIHPRAVEIAMAENIPVIVKSTFSDAPGTLITNAAGAQGAVSEVTVKAASGVTYIRELVQFRIPLDVVHPEKGQKLFSHLADEGVSVGCLNFSDVNAMFAVYRSEAERVEEVLVRDGFNYDENRDCAKVCVVGSHMEGVPGVMATFVSALAREDIQILQTVDSDVTLAAIIREDKLEQAVNALHTAFKL